MKSVAAVRAALGIRTIFNILGPLTNPAAPPFLLIGAYSLEVAQLMADTLAGMEVERAFVVHGADGWDEPTPVGPFVLFDVRPGHVAVQTRLPADFGLATCSAERLAGKDAQHNAAALEAVLCAEDGGAHRDCLLLGTALALELTGRACTARAAVAQAAEAIASGAARDLLGKLRASESPPATAAAVRATHE